MFLGMLDKADYDVAQTIVQRFDLIYRSPEHSESLRGVIGFDLPIEQG